MAPTQEVSERHPSNITYRCIAILSIMLLGGGFTQRSVSSAGKADPANPQVSVTLYGSSLEWNGSPQTEVYGTITFDGYFEAKANPIVSDGSGVARLEFGQAQTCRICQKRTGHLVPGSQVTIIARGYEALIINLPNIAVDVDFETNQVGGIGPVGSMLDLNLADPMKANSKIEQSILVNERGVFALDLSGRFDVTSAVRGDLSFVTEEGHKIISPVIVPSVRVTVGRPIGCIVHRGKTLTVRVEDFAGNNKYSSCERRTAPVEPGDIVVIERGPYFLVKNVAESVELVVPQYQVVFDRLAEQLFGTGPSGDTIGVEFKTAFRETSSTRIKTDVNGKFSLPLPNEPAPEITLSIDGKNGITASETVAERALFVGLQNAGFTIYLGHSLEPVGGQMILSDSRGEARAEIGLPTSTGWVEIPWIGEWPQGGESESDEVIIPEPGDLLELSYDDVAHPIVETVPEITVNVDASQRQISGITRPNSTIIVTISGKNAFESDVQPVSVRSDDSGRFIATLPAGAGFVAGAWGLVTVWSSESSIAFYSTWNISKYLVELDAGYLSAQVGLNETARVDLLRNSDSPIRSKDVSSGRFLSLTGERSRRTQAGWSTWFGIQEEGTVGAADLMTGDIFAISSDRGNDRLTIPLLEAYVDFNSDIIEGQTEPGYSVMLTVHTPALGDPTHFMLPQEFPIGVVENGRFVLDLTDRFDLRSGDTIFVSSESPAGHRFTRFVQVPSLLLMADSGWLIGQTGTLRQGLEISATVWRDGAGILAIKGENGVPDWDQFLLRLRDVDGHAFALRPGDRIEVKIGTTPPKHLSLEIPDYQVAVNWNSGRLQGHLRAGGRIELRGTDTMAYPVPGVEGVFDVPIIQPGASRSWAWPGNRATVKLYLDTGHIISHRFVYPTLSIEHEGLRVEGMVTPLTRVVTYLLDAQGNNLAEGETTAKEYLDEGLDGDPTTNVVLELKPREMGARIQAGHRLRVMAGDVETVIEIPSFTVKMDWEQGILDGQGPAGSKYEQTTQGTRGCSPTPGFSWAPPEPVRYWQPLASSSQSLDGRFQHQLRMIIPGQRNMVGFQDETGHRIYKTFVRTTSQIDMEQATVSGCTQPLEEIAVLLKDEGKTQRAFVRARADSAGFYRLQLRPTDARPYIQATDSMEICVYGDCKTMAMINAPTIVDKEENGITGIGNPGRTTYATLGTFQGEAHDRQYPQLDSSLMSRYYPWTIQVALDAMRRFEIDDQMLEDARMPWRVKDVHTLRVWSEIDGGHYAVTDYLRNDMSTVYLPRVFVK